MVIKLRYPVTSIRNVNISNAFLSEHPFFSPFDFKPTGLNVRHCTIILVHGHEKPCRFSTIICHSGGRFI